MAKKKNQGKQKLSELPVAGLRDLSQSTCLALIVLAGVVSYGFTLSVPFYLDDFPSIRENPAIRDLTDIDAVLGFAPARALGYLTFALNYAMHGYSPAGYHIFNILIHSLAGIAMYFLLHLLIRARRFTAALPERAVAWLPLFVALLFILHPLQTQAVTYSVQRLAIMSAMLYLGSLLFYVAARTGDRRGAILQCYLSALVCASAAMLVKQNAVTIPAAVLLVEVTLLGLQGRRMAKVVGGLVAMGLMAIGIIYFLVTPDFFQSLSEATAETDLVSRWQYLAIQMQVLWLYIVKFLLPVNLHLEYDIPVTSFASPVVWVFATGHLLLIGFGCSQIRKRPLLAFGILFYYLTHSVESSIIPIRDFAFEHRTYLPNFGLCLMYYGQRTTQVPPSLPRRRCQHIDRRREPQRFTVERLSSRYSDTMPPPAYRTTGSIQSECGHVSRLPVGV